MTPKFCITPQSALFRPAAACASIALLWHPSVAQSDDVFVPIAVDRSMDIKSQYVTTYSGVQDHTFQQSSRIDEFGILCVPHTSLCGHTYNYASTAGVAGQCDGLNYPRPYDIYVAMHTGSGATCTTNFFNGSTIYNATFQVSKSSCWELKGYHGFGRWDGLQWVSSGAGQGSVSLNAPTGQLYSNSSNNTVVNGSLFDTNFFFPPDRGLFFLTPGTYSLSQATSLDVVSPPAENTYYARTRVGFELAPLCECFDCGLVKNKPFITIQAIEGMDTSAIGECSSQQDPHGDGRVFMDTTGAGPKLGTPGAQSIIIKVMICADIVNSRQHHVRWQLFDPDDPSDSQVLDPNGPFGGDNSGTPFENASHWFTEADHSVTFSGPPQTGIDEFTVLGETETAISPWGSSYRSSITMNCSDDGGDNYMVRVALVDRHGDELCVDYTGMITVWRHRELELFAMPGYGADIDQAILSRTFAGLDGGENAFIDIKLIDKASTTIPYISPMNHTLLAALMDAPLVFAHSLGRMSLLGVHAISGASGNASEVPHAMVARGIKDRLVGWFYSPGMLSCHEIGHLLLSEFCQGRSFHEGHSSTCIFTLGAPGTDICSYHVSTLRDRVALDYGNLHVASAVQYDSVVGR